MQGTRRLRRVALIAALSPFLGAAFIILAQPLWAFSALSRVLPGMLFRVDTDAVEVALSFDDGPDDIHTARVLEVRARHRAPATLFMIGDRAVGRQNIVHSVGEAGHEIGNHYFTIGSAVRATNERSLGDVIRHPRRKHATRAPVCFDRRVAEE